MDPITILSMLDAINIKIHLFLAIYYILTPNNATLTVF